MEEYVVEEEKLNHEVVVFGCGSAVVVLIVEPINVSVSSKSSCDASSNAILCLNLARIRDRVTFLECSVN